MVAMTLKEIIEKCSKLGVYERRYVTDDYDGLVFYNRELDKWNKIFTAILGPSIKPAGVKPTKDDLRLTKDYGGINDNQTLFKKGFDDATVIAMFWPWQDGVHATLKMVSLKR